MKPHAPHWVYDLGTGIVMASLLIGCRTAPTQITFLPVTPTEEVRVVCRVTLSPIPSPSPSATPFPTPTPPITATHRPSPTPTATATPPPSPTATPPPVISPTPASPPVLPTPTAAPPMPSPPVPREERYRLGGIDFADPTAPLTIAYPADLEGEGWVVFEGLEILVADLRGTQYRRFVTEYDGQIFVYPEMVSGRFVLNVHDGTLLRTGRALEAEPLRRMLEGPLHNPLPMEEIEARLDKLIGREFRFTQREITARFRVVQAHRMGASDVQRYRNRAGHLSEYMGGLNDPQRSFLMLFCSGRQPGEQGGTFAGRYVLVLELLD